MTGSKGSCRRHPVLVVLWSTVVISVWYSQSVSSQGPISKCTGTILTGSAAFGDWRSSAPGICRRITVNDLPPPFATPSGVAFAAIIPRPAGAWPQVKPNFKVDEFFTGLNNSRIVRVAPNGDIFVAEMMANRIRVLRAADGASKPDTASIYASGLNLPFGIAFYPPGPNPQWVYVGNTGSVVRFAYQNGDLVARGAPEVIVPVLPVGGDHFTRDVTFSLDGSKMYVSVGSWTNYGENGTAIEEGRAQVNQYNPDGSGFKVFGSGIRNAVGIAINPTTGKLWVSVNERDGLGDNLVPDYISHVDDGDFFGWPWYYINGTQDPRQTDAHPELRAKERTPDVLLQAHSASLEMAFYTGSSFPSEYMGDAFASEHGSWNRGNRTGYKVIRVPMINGIATGEYEDFMTGFVTDTGDVWGRPVGVAVARDGALLVSDDGANTIWRISYVGNGTSTATQATTSPATAAPAPGCTPAAYYG
ncbi:L-sorbosone dehydrogenase-like [Paramacrobiotus metropolitanus]|uniref:L-sorbosone dehydrogenase-like n=1 Tax=Paramacrobiotus metropolitanus TaxID=2943436 RepID=UPI002445A06E|nr:L-sorbosone dehydrogenase-like [Paramacrobiotus metropolitanus]XP_055329222.1 L-sorbosone dehydrogenase-like [Paramacrobiotus metropolitanus]